MEGRMNVCPLCTGAHHASMCPNAPADAAPTLLKPDRRSTFPQPDLAPCGTNAAAKRHRRDGLGGKRLKDVCPECAEAERAYSLPFIRDHRNRSRRTKEV